MGSARRNPRVLVVTPEVTYLPDRMGNLASFFTAKAGGLADVSAALVSALFDQGADVHVALPDYRSIFSDRLVPFLKEEISSIQRKMPDDRVHLAEDRAFFYINRVYSKYGDENIKLALAFQREVVNNIIPRVQPDLIHCNDWMTGLIPSVARRLRIPCLFTIHNIHTVKSTLAFIEDRGLDAASFWQHLYYMNYAPSYEGARDANPVDFLTSGIFAAHFVNTVSPTFLLEIVDGLHHFVEPQIRHELANKYYAGCALRDPERAGPDLQPGDRQGPEADVWAQGSRRGQAREQALHPAQPRPDRGPRGAALLLAVAPRPRAEGLPAAGRHFLPARLDLVGPQPGGGLRGQRRVPARLPGHRQPPRLPQARRHMRFQRADGAPGLRGLRLHPHAVALRALRPAADDRPQVRVTARGPRHRAASTTRCGTWTRPPTRATASFSKSSTRPASSGPSRRPCGSTRCRPSPAPGRSGAS